MFSKSQRFSDSSNKTAPGPGDYNVKEANTASLGSFPKELRFSDSSDAEGVGPAAYGTITGATKPKAEFKTPRQVKKKSWRNAVSVQTDLQGAVTAEQVDMQKIIDGLRTQCTSFQEELNAVIAKHNVEKADFNTKQSENHLQLSDFKRLLDEEICSTSQLKFELSTAKSQLEQDLYLKQQITDLTTQLEKVSETRSSLEVDLAALRIAVEQEKDSVCTLEADISDRQNKHQAENESLNKEILKLSGEKDELAGQIQSLNHTMQIQDDSISSLTMSLSTETHLRVSTEAASANKNETIACLKSTIAQLQTHIADWETLQEGSLERQKQLEEQVTSTTSSISTLSDQLSNLKLANDQSRSENERLQLTNHSSTQKISKLEACVQTLGTEKNSLADKLEQARALQDIVRQKEAKIEELLDLNTLLSTKLDDHKELRRQIATMEDTVTSILDKHQEEIASYEGMLAETRSERERLKEGNTELGKEVVQMQANMEAVKDQFSDKIVSLQTKLASVNQEKSEDLVKQTATLKDERDTAIAEAAEVKLLHTELQEKIAPFKEQLDAYEIERKLLKGQTKNWASEAAKATQECANLLGHQNQKQKIKRINQISDENFHLKQEVMNLRSSESKLKRQLSQHQEKIRQLEGKKRFDTSKALQRDNTDNENRAPLKAFNPTDN